MRPHVVRCLPELVVRRLVHAMGYRYRLRVRSLPGAPDMVFPRLRKIINVNGCFWHLYGRVLLTGRKGGKSRFRPDGSGLLAVWRNRHFGKRESPHCLILKHSCRCAKSVRDCPKCGRRASNAVTACSERRSVNRLTHSDHLPRPSPRRRRRFRSILDASEGDKHDRQ